MFFFCRLFTLIMKKYCDIMKPSSDKKIMDVHQISLKKWVI